jgi:hypothetical protein
LFVVDRDYAKASVAAMAPRRKGIRQMLTKPRISIVRASDRKLIESSTLKNDRGRIFRFALDRAYDQAERLEIAALMVGKTEQYFVIVERVLDNGTVIAG